MCSKQGENKGHGQVELKRWIQQKERKEKKVKRLGTFLPGLAGRRPNQDRGEHRNVAGVVPLGSKLRRVRA